MAFKQRHAKTIFQLSDLSADGARRHPEPVSGNLETPSPGGFGKGTQGVQWQSFDFHELSFPDPRVPD